VRQQLLSRVEQATSLTEQVELVNEQAAEQLASPSAAAADGGVELSIVTTAGGAAGGAAPTAPLSPTAAAAAASGPNGMDRLFLRFMPRKILGVFYLAFSAVVFSVMSLCVSLAGKDLPSFEIVWARSMMLFGLATSSCYFVARTNPIGPPAKRKWLFLRGFVGFLSFSCYYYSMSRLSLADATTIMFSSPLYTGILGFLFLRERVSRFDVALTVISISGVIMVVRGGGSSSDSDNPSADDDSLHTMGLIIGIIGSVISAFVYVAIRKVGSGVNPLVLVSYMGGIGTILAPLGATIQTFHTPSGADSWALIFGVGIFSYIGQIFFNAGVQLEKAGPASMIRNLDVAFSFIWQVAVLHDQPKVWSVLGALIISSCVAVMGVRKWRQESAKSRVEPATATADQPQQPADALAAATADAKLQGKLERAVPAAAHLLSSEEEWRSSGAPLRAHSDADSASSSTAARAAAGGEDDPLFRRKYSLELEATDVTLHEEDVAPLAAKSPRTNWY